MTPPRPAYFHHMNWTMLVLVFLGFAPSFYLKPLVAEQPFYPNGLPVPYIVHGIILTVWYVFMVVQTTLIKNKKIATHRKLGWFGAAWAVLVVLSTVYAVTIFPGRMVALAQQLNSTVDEVEPGLVFILWLDIFMCTLFVAFIIIAIIQRLKPDIHKRFILYTGLVFIFAASNRVAGTIAYLTDSSINLVLGPLILLVLTASLLVHDYKTQKRILPVSWWCFGLYWLAMILSFVIAGTDFGKSILNI
ncbi:MAG: hypothetical protein KF845_05350 [Cyclobacteriaceae bacterium]|nr:hypothetical protein [Cyclobacteriaceae bacterium]